MRYERRPCATGLVTSWTRSPLWHEWLAHSWISGRSAFAVQRRLADAVEAAARNAASATAKLRMVLRRETLSMAAREEGWRAFHPCHRLPRPCHAARFAGCWTFVLSG